MTEAQEEAIYFAQDEWISERFGMEVAERANYGWAVDDIEGQISTKVYGYGILTTNVKLEHTWKEMS